MNEIKHAIDELSNLKSMKQLEEETARVKKANQEMEQRNKDQKYRLEQATIRIQKIEEEEREKCRKTAEILKQFEQQSTSGPFFTSLLDILNNFLGTFFSITTV